MARRASPVPGWIPADLPGAPGVYRFVDANGTALYIGKSVNLRRRVRGYFYGGGPSDPDKRDMLRLARALEYRLTGSDLEALLAEAE
ncbi:MAG: nucleotide excision repair endonuclease, partial [Gemmatimonadota bacterium]